MILRWARQKWRALFKENAMAKMKIGDIVEVNGSTRIITHIGQGYFQSEPYEKTETEVETIVVKNRKKGKKDDDMA